MPSYQNITSAIKFRIYGWAAQNSGSNSQFGINDFTFNGTVCTSPVITGQPLATQTLCQNATPTNLNVAATGSSLTYQWYSNTSNSNTGGTSLGATNGGQTMTYTPPTSSIGTVYYYCIVKSGSCSTTSNVSTVNVLSGAPSITGQPLSTQTVCQNIAPTNLTVTATGSGLSYQWYSSNDNVTNTSGDDVTVGTNSPNYTPLTTTAGTKYYYCQVTGCAITKSNTAAVIVTALPTTSNAGPDQTGSSTCGLTTVTLAANTPTIGTGAWSVVSGSGGTFSTASSPVSTFSGTIGTTYTLRWTISNSPCTASTDDVVITFNQNPVAIFASVTDITVACGAATTSSLGYSNGVSGACAISGSVTSSISNQSPLGNCGGNITETWTFTDNYNRTITTSRVIHVSPAALPTRSEERRVGKEC